MKDFNEEYVFEDDVMQVHLSGNFPNELLRREGNIFQPLIDRCLTHKCRKALIDARDLQVRLNAFQMFSAGQDAATLSRLSLRVAFLGRKEMIDPFFKTVLSNRGGDVGVFTDKQAAIEWLER